MVRAKVYLDVHSLVVGCREFKLELSWNLPPCWLIFIVLQVTVKAAHYLKGSIGVLRFQV